MTRSALTSPSRRAAVIPALVLCLAAALAAQARPVPVYVVDVAGQSPAALQDAMRQALVRTTGHREAATDPALAAIVSSAAGYVKSYTKGAQGQTQVVFDGPAVERAIKTAGLDVWAADRPFTLVTLAPPPARPAEDSTRIELEQQAARRGLLILVVPVPVTDASGKELGGDALLQSAQRYGAEQVLVGRQEGTQYRWTLYGAHPHPSWSGSLAAGIDGAVDAIAPPVGETLAGGAAGADEGVMRIEVQGITGLADYVNVERLLQAVPGVRRARMYEAQGTQASFELSLRGGADALDRALASQPKLVRAATGGGGSPVYQYHP
jgi:uncharacterized protein